MNSKQPLAFAITLAGALLAIFSTGCGRSSHDHGHGGHAHAAPHGGVLVELGAHQANLEFVHDASVGALDVYLLDAHAENFVRISAPSLAASVSVAGGATQPLLLRAVANPATGETVGDTSQFRAEAETLKGPGPFEVLLSSVTLPAGTFNGVRVAFPVGSGHDGHAHEGHAH
ncbi:hypothetical protein [Congregicoccus parvus]|uniref:hypothetical protein n=1 Tax=Congregicoccus parvus TaxID=3081749 RepID=UPI003FA54519